MKKTLIYIIILIMILISGCAGVPEATETINTDISDTEIITETGDDVTMPDKYGECTPTEEFAHSDFMDECVSGITIYSHEDTFEFRKIVAEYGYLYDRW